MVRLDREAMNKKPQKTRLANSNPWAASVRLKARSLKRAYGQRRHDLRIGRQPNYVDKDRTLLNRVLIEPRPLPKIKKEIERLRRSNGAKRAMKSDAAVVSAGVITFGHKVAELFARLSPDEQDAALLELVTAIADKLGTHVEAMVVHLDETSLHAHFEMRAYDGRGVPVSKVATFKVMSELQDMTADIMAIHCPGIERGHKKFDRIKAGADYADTLNRSVKQLHQDLPAEIAARQAELADLEGQQVKLSASVDKTRGYLQKLNAKDKLNEKEAKRLKTYEARLAKKDVEQASLEQRHLQMKAQLSTAQDALKSREIAVMQTEDDARVKVEAANASLAAIDAVAQELEGGTMARDGQGKITMNDPSPVRAAPKGLAKRLVRLARRFLKLQDRMVQKEGYLDKLAAALKSLLVRDDLLDHARAEGEKLRQELDDGPEF